MTISPSALPFELYAQDAIMQHGIERVAHAVKTDRPQDTNAWILKRLKNGYVNAPPPKHT